MVDKTFTIDAILKATSTKTFAMDAILELSGEITLGALTLIVDFDGIRPVYNKRTANHSILGATNSKRQFLGSDSKQYEVSGIFEGASRDADIAILRGYFENNNVLAFQGYGGLAVQTTIVEFQEIELTVHWEYRILIEETGNP